MRFSSTWDWIAFISTTRELGSDDATASRTSCSAARAIASAV
jgi:hypothetical protein